MIADNVKNIVWLKRGCKELRGLREVGFVGFRVLKEVSRRVLDRAR
jgi:hypothetical protein